MQNRKSKVYSFNRDKVKKIFNDAIKRGLQLPEPKRPKDVGKIDDSNYCLYHRLISHPIEDCWVFKDWIEKQYKTGAITLSRSVLTDPQVEETNAIGAGTEEMTGLDNPLHPESWNTFD